MRVKKEIVSVSYSKNHSNFDYCCSFYVRKKGVNFLFDAICKCGYIAFENVLIDETDMRLLCDTAEDALEILKKYNPEIPIQTNMSGFIKKLDQFTMTKKLDIVGWDNYPWPDDPA